MLDGSPRVLGRTSPIVVVLLVLILVAMVGLVVAFAPRGSSGQPGADTRPTGSSTKPPLREIKDGSVVTRSELEEQGSKPPSPSKAADSKRIAQTYKPGTTYRSVIRVAVKARASHQDWGIVEDATMQYVGESEIIRTIESNDGATLVLVQEFRKARTLTAFTRVEGIRFQLPAAGLIALDTVVAPYMGLPPGSMELAVATANQVFSNPAVLSLLNNMRDDPSAKLFANFVSLEGKKVRITYVNGRGVDRIEPLGCSLNGEDQETIAATAVISDAYVFPDPDIQPGAEWQIQGQDMLPVVDPSLRATLAGRIRVKRGPDSGSGDTRAAQIAVAGGMLDLQDSDGSSETKARWAPTGTMSFSFRDGIITSAQLSGDLRIEKRSTDHVLFEAKFSVKPDYIVTYACEVVR